MSAAPDIRKAERKHPSFEKHVPYLLNWEAFGSDQCKIGQKKNGEKPEFRSMKFSDLIGLLREKEITKFDTFMDTTVSFDGIEHVIQCEGMGQSILPIMLTLIQKKCELSCVWYFYDSDRVKDDFHEHYLFFLVNKNKIVLENASVSHSSSSWLNPDFLTYDGDHIWANHSAMEKAAAVWWYQKFYSETELGQIIKIRDAMDNNDVGATATTQSAEVISLRQLISQTSKTNNLLIWILIAIAALAFYHHG